MEIEENVPSKKKSILLILAIIIGSAAAILGFIVSIKQYIRVDVGTFYAKSGNKYTLDDNNYAEDLGDSKYKVIVNGKEYMLKVDVDSTDIIYSFDDGQVVYGINYSFSGDSKPSYSTLRTKPLLADGSESIDDSRVSRACILAGMIYYKDLSKVYSPIIWMLGIALYAVSVYGFIYPEKLAFIGKRWQFKDGKPQMSDAAIVVAKVTYVLTSIMGLFLMSGVISFFLLKG